jgi:hypothetical protein
MMRVLDESCRILRTDNGKINVVTQRLVANKHTVFIALPQIHIWFLSAQGGLVCITDSRKPIQTRRR